MTQTNEENNETSTTKFTSFNSNNNNSLNINNNNKSNVNNSSPPRLVNRLNGDANTHSAFRVRNKWREDFEARALYAVHFNHCDRALKHYFATAGGYRASVYKLCPESGAIEIIQSYRDQDNHEMFYTLAWSIGVVSRAPHLVLAGVSGIIKVIDLNTHKPIRGLVGHGGAINEIRTFRRDCNIIVSASKDRSVRLWNLHTAICIAIFAGEAAHLQEVLSVDVNLSCTMLVSSGMDHSIRIWAIDSALQKHIDDSKQRQYHPAEDSSVSVLRGGIAPFRPLHIHFPIFFTRRIHSNYVDHVRWWGNIIASKSVENAIVLWKPDLNSPHRLVHRSGTANILRRLKMQNCTVWFVRFAIDARHTTMACGNLKGGIACWNLNEFPAKSRPVYSQCQRTVRMVDFGPDSKWLVAVCDDRSVHLLRTVS